MKRFSRMCILLLLVAAMLCPGLLFVGAAAYDSGSDGIVSAYYHIDYENGFIYGVAPGTSSAHLLSVCLPSNCSLSQEGLSTGTTISSGEHTLTVIVTGDLNGDGSVTITDLLMQKSAILGETLSTTAMAAGDVNYDGGVTITDFLQVKSTLLGLSSIESGRPQGTSPPDPIILLTPGTSQSWHGGDGTASYTCSNPALASVDENGIITGTATGSAFVYALDEESNILSRVIVSVVDQPLAVSFGTSLQSMTPGQSLTLTARLNHPVAAPVTWASSDESIATVNQDGTVTALVYGSTVITATLPNGSTAQTEISVAPPLTLLSIERSVYKVKPGNYRFPKLTVEPADCGEEIIWTSSDPSIAQVGPDGTVYGVSYGDVTITATGRYTGLSASCTVSVCDVRQVAITFDDGPSGNTPGLLDYLKNNNIPVTFFLVGNVIPYHSDTVIRQASEGHEIGYHSYSHQNQRFLSSEQIISDFEKTNNMLKDLTGREFTLWRTPGGDYDQRVLDCIQLPHIYWSVDTQDWKTLNANAVYQEIINKAVDGSIVLMHDLYGSTIQGAIRAMDALAAAGYEFLTVTELLSRDGTPPQNSTNYYHD